MQSLTLNRGRVYVRLQPTQIVQMYYLTVTQALTRWARRRYRATVISIAGSVFGNRGRRQWRP
jgi:hypothetical protein